MTRSTAYRVTGLDCAEEVRALKGAVGPVVGDEERLAFDLLRGRMIIRGPVSTAESRRIREVVAEIGMEATPWSEDPGETETWWRRRGRSALCAVSGLAVALGVGLHAAGGAGLLPALGGGGQVPLVSRLLYLGAIAGGLRWVLPRAWSSLRRRAADMNLLMTVAIAGALILGEWLEAATVAFLFALALELERWSIGRARRAISSLLDLAPPTARVVDERSGDTGTSTPVEEIGIGARIRVRPGEKVPLDGRVCEGRTTVDESPITGESLPSAKEPGDPVYAGTVNRDGTLEIEVTRAANDTTLARIIRRVEEAQTRRAPTERWVDRFARVYTPLMMALAAVVAVVPPLVFGDFAAWFYRALVLLVIACPCALVISTPVSVVAGLARAARAGVLVQGGQYLEIPATLRAIAFDKTGTLTLGEPRVVQVVALQGHDEAEVLAIAAALECESNHPLASAVLEEARRRAVDFAPATRTRELRGLGIVGTLEGRPAWIGNHRFVIQRSGPGEAGGPDPDELAAAMEGQGRSVVAVGEEDHVCGLLAVADEIRPEAREAIRQLRASGVERLELLTGDNQRTAECVAAALGLDAARSELLPEEKVEAVRRLQAEVGPTAMVGDGINDAPALAASSVGIAMGVRGSDAAIETADIALMTDELRRLPWLVRHSRRTLNVIRQNIIFALAVKAAFLLLAAAGVATLWMAIAADMGASLLVIANALRLLR